MSCSKVKVCHSSNLLYHGCVEKYFVYDTSYIAKPKTKKENLGSVGILVSNGALKLNFFHLKPTFV